MGLGLWLILGLEILYIFSFLLNYDMAWMNSENFGTHAWILSNGNSWQTEDFVRSLNIDVIESNGERISRPLSNLFEVINAKFRANLWNLIPPHPSLSVLWPAFFLVLPWCLFRFFTNMGCQTPVAVAGVCLYLSSLGFLAPVVMLFHPAKSMVNIFAVLALYCGSELYRRNSFHVGYFVAFLISMFCAFLSDETGLFAFVMAALLLYPLVWKFKGRGLILLGFLALPVVYYVTVHHFLPHLHLWVRGKEMELTQYSSYPHLSAILAPDWKNVATNFSWLWNEHPNLRLDFGRLWGANPALCALHVVYVATLGFVGTLMGVSIIRRGLTVRVIMCVFLVVAYILFYTFQLSNNARVWGAWWYGTLYSLVFFTAFIFVLQYIDEGPAGPWLRRFFVGVIAVMTVHGLVFSTYGVDVFVHKPNHRAYTPKEIFSGDIGEYYKNFSWLDSMRRSRCRRIWTVSQWADAKHKKLHRRPQELEACQAMKPNDPTFSDEATYMSIEL